MSLSGQSPSPGDVAVAGGIIEVAAFGEDPALADIILPEREVIGTNVLLGPRDSLLGKRKLVHQGEAHVLLLCGKVDLEKAAGEKPGGFPADLATDAALITRGLQRVKIAEKIGR